MMGTAVGRRAAALLLLGPAAPALSGVPEGLGFLERSQAADGSWGSLEGLRDRDTAVALETLRRYGRTDGGFALGRAFLGRGPSANLDFAARRSLVESLAGGADLLGSLWSARRAAAFDPTDANYPEGGWGLAPGFQSDSLDTALVLDAFAAGGFAAGLTARGEVLAVSQERVYAVRTPADATSVSAYVPALAIQGGSGSLNVWFVGPAGRFPSAGWFVVTLPNTLIVWDGADTPPFAPGLVEVHVRDDAASSGPATFDLELSFVARGIDSRDLAEPVDYLRAARNPGQGWGPLVGSQTDLLISLHALLALQAFERAFDTAADAGAGVAWLKGQANGDGGFGTGPGSTAFETALAYMALAADDPGGAETLAARAWLESRQLAGGSWSDDPYQTALAVKALSWADPDADGDLVRDPFDNCAADGNGDQTDTDGDGSGDSCDADDDDDLVLDGAVAGDPSNVPFRALDILSMTATLPPQPPGNGQNGYINFVVFDPTTINLGWWDATNQAWIDAGVSPDQRRMAFFVDTNSCLCIDMDDGDTLTPTTDNGTPTIWLPDRPAGWQGWLYVADDGSTYFDGALTSLAKAAPTEPGDNCRIVWNPGQHDRDGDDTGDACDPDDGEVGRLRILRDDETISWTAEQGALAYNVYRGQISALPAGSYGACLDVGVLRDANLDGEPDATDLGVPPAGGGYDYLVTAEMTWGEGSLGRDGSGAERANATPCP